VKILRLELFGFKSFKDKTIISFEQPITAIVGSNGCGKSNVIDALYWVMGDMSAKHLRGQTMTDVIFSGSRDSAPLDLAEVTLVLERDPEKDPELPPQFQASNEIQITRRYYRNGESEYLINKIICRLRDIQEFFMDTGVGVKAYSIIEQGAISRLVTQKPEERRSVIEEVAGVMKFKARKAETERKIENSKTNLSRIDDILKDLRRNLANLKAQSTKAEKYKSYSEELKSLEIRLASRNWIARNSQKTEAEKQVHDLRSAIEECERSLNSSREELENATISLMSTEDELTLSRQNCRRIELQIKDIEGQVQSLNVRRDALLEQSESNQQGVIDSEKRSVALDADIQAITEELDGLNLKSADCYTKLEEAEHQSEVLHEAAEQQREEVNELRRQLHSIELEDTRLTQEIQGLQKSLSQYQNKKTNLLSNIETIKAEISEKAGSRESTLGALELAFSNRSDLESAKSEVDRKILHLEGERHDLQARRDQAREKETVVRVKKEQFEALDQNMEGVEVTSKTLAMHLRSQGVEETLLADAVKATPLFEKALEAVLGRDLQRVVAQSFVQIDELRGVLQNASSAEAKSARSQFWIPGLSVLQERASMVSPADTYYLRATDSTPNLSPELAPVYSENYSSDFSSGNGMRFSEVPGPDGLVSQTVSEAVTQSDLPLNNIRVQSVREFLANHPEVIGPFSDILVSEVPEAKNAPWMHLVRDFWVVRSRDAFANLIEALDSCPVSFVSLDGDLLSKEGYLDLAPVEAKAGSENASLVARKREIKELRTQEAQAQEVLRLAQEALDQCMARYQEAKNEFRELTARLAALNPDVERLSHLLRQDEATLARLNEKQMLQEQELKNSEASIAQTTQQIDELMTKVEESRLKREAAEELFQNAEDALKLALQSFHAHENVVSQVETEHQNLEKQLISMQAKKASFEQEKKNAQDRILQLQARLQELSDSIAQTAVEIEASLEKLNQETEVFEEAQKVQEALNLQLQTERSKAKDLQNKVDAESSKLHRLSDLSKDLQQQIAINDVEIRNILQRVQEQYQLMLDSLTEVQLQELTTSVDIEELADPSSAQARIDQLRKKIENLGKINMVAVEEFDEQSKRYEYLFIQRQDVFDGIQQLIAAVERIDRESRERFAEAFVAVNNSFQKTFPVLFGGGNAELRLTDPDNLLESGVEIVAQPPGKKLQSVTLLSGGEKALTAVSLIFGIFSIKPSPFCVLDEVDAPLDDANVGRFNQQIRNMAETSQIIMITHHKQTMEHADALFGVTMEQPGVSKVASVKLGELKKA
jgi:chromosome segregation protein